jgi:hypothetical protein
VRRVITTLALALCLGGCGSVPKGGPVALRIDEEADPEQCCVLSHSVLDIVAGPTFGTVGKAHGEPLTWPRGDTARWAGFEVEVSDHTGKVVLTTPGRYWIT